MGWRLVARIRNPAIAKAYAEINTHGSTSVGAADKHRE
jgi:hypothetical protein